jgi:hypothetical protein
LESSVPRKTNPGPDMIRVLINHVRGSRNFELQLAVYGTSFHLNGKELF